MCAKENGGVSGDVLVEWWEEEIMGSEESDEELGGEKEVEEVVVVLLQKGDGGLVVVGENKELVVIGEGEREGKVASEGEWLKEGSWVSGVVKKEGEKFDEELGRESGWWRRGGEGGSHS